MATRAAPPEDPAATRLLVARAAEQPTLHITRPAPDQPTRPIALPRTEILDARRPRVTTAPTRRRVPPRSAPSARPPVVQPRRLRIPFGTLLAGVLLVTAMGGMSSLRGEPPSITPDPPPATVADAPLPPR